MASVQIYSLQFLQDNPYGTYVAGDVIDIYMDTAATIVPSDILSNQSAGISLLLNGSPITSGPMIPGIFSGVYSFTNFQVTYCVTTSAVFFNPSIIFPYSAYVTVADHPSCALDPSVCDLIVVGVPEVVAASTATDTDGSITVTASSTNPIRYKIASDFIYEDGSGQIDGYFAGLVAGEHRIYLRDSKNCSANVLVTVPINNTYAPKYLMEYDDLNGWQTKIEILRRAYTDDVIEVIGSGTPFKIALRGEGATDKFEAVLAGNAHLELTSITDFQFQEIYTNDMELYRLNYYKDTGSGYELKWTGKVLPQQYLEHYKAPPYPVSVVAVCGLPELKDHVLVQGDGQKYYGTTKLIKLIAQVLKANKLDLPIRVACNLYATTMLQTAADDPLDQAYCDFERFYLIEENPKYSLVLKSILEPFGTSIIQWEGRWNIVRVEEKIAAYDYRDFDSNGDYTGNGTYDPVRDIVGPSTEGGDAILAMADHSLELRPGYGLIRVIYDLGLRDNIIINGDFRLNSVYHQPTNSYSYTINRDKFTLVNAGYPLSEGYESIQSRDDEFNVGYTLTAYGSISGEAYLQSAAYALRMGTNNSLKISFRAKVKDPSFGVGNLWYSANVPYTKFRVMVQYGDLYLKQDGSWGTAENKLTFFVTEWDKFQQFEVIAKCPVTETPFSGMDFSVRLYQAYAYHAQFYDVDDLRAFPTYDGSGGIITSSGYKTEIRTNHFSGSYEGIYFYALQDTTDADDDYNVIRPDDYGVNNERAWVRNDGVGGFFQEDYLGIAFAKHQYTIDFLKVEFLTDGGRTFDAVLRSAVCEVNNRDTFDKKLFFGSFAELFATESKFYLDLGWLFPNQDPGLHLKVLTYLSPEILYTAYLRDVDGNGYEYWKRDGVGESVLLHGILLKAYALQYRRPWRLLRGSYKTRTYIGFLDVLRMTTEANRIYLPMGIELNDKRCIYQNCELLELVSGTVSPFGGEYSSEYGSGFSGGFGSGYE